MNKLALKILTFSLVSMSIQNALPNTLYCYTQDQLGDQRCAQQIEEQRAAKLRKATQEKQNARLARLKAEKENALLKAEGIAAQEGLPIHASIDEAKSSPQRWKNSALDKVVLLKDKAVQAKNTVVSHINAHSYVVKGTVALAAGYALYTNKEKIKTLAHKHPYIVGSIGAFSALVAGTSVYTGLPMSDCLTTGLYLAWDIPMKVSAWVNVMMLGERILDTLLETDESHKKEAIVGVA